MGFLVFSIATRTAVAMAPGADSRQGVIVNLATIQSVLSEKAGVQFSPGLTISEFDVIEQRYELVFPPDLREFLSIGLPVSKGWVNWRDDTVESIRKRLSWPFDGICFDIEHNVFWLDEWGEKPGELGAAFEIARRAVEQAPKLIPICSHRYIPSSPLMAGNPVFSVYQTDVVYYGADLLDYLQNEFSYYVGRSGCTITREPRQIAFWSMLTEM